MNEGEHAPQARLVFEGFDHVGNELSVGLMIDPEQTDKELANRLHEMFFAVLRSWIEVPDDGSTSMSAE